MDIECKFLPMTTGVSVTDDFRITGYASRFGASDQGGDTVAKGAYAASLATGRKVMMLWQHDPSQPIGIWEEIREDDAGLWVKGHLLEGVEKAREAAALIRAGAIDGLSIGYRTVRAEKAAGGGRLLTELELWEVSLVTFPMLPSARVSAKGDSPDDPLRDVAAALNAARQEMAGQAPR
ncbi:HK97 family phage prohead protease [Pseudooceanicola sp. C21-150M6]|uniref:HK97 family phage prohead protease n=1 Tax=Pseudooceanicola sp. C21-150M6 TaxID=3434355 RepID=UPI003D7F56A7